MNKEIVVLNNVCSLDRYYVKNELHKLRSSGQRCFMFYPHEWATRSEQIFAHVASYSNPNLRRVFARKCQVKEVSLDVLRAFCDQYHIQGSNRLAIMAWGLYLDNELLGVLSVGRHHRNQDSPNLILDRMCFKSEIRVVGGASRLFNRALQFGMEQGFETIVSYSDNRYSTGQVYEKMGFKLIDELAPDYFYVLKNDELTHFSKQSQQKKQTNCPQDMTEEQWCNTRGMVKVFDAGKKKWEYKLVLRKSVKSFSQRRQGYYTSSKAGVMYYSSSYELRTAYLLDQMPEVTKFNPQVHVVIEGRDRYLDFLVARKDGSHYVVESKPERKLLECADQIADNRKIAEKHGWGFEIWTEKELGMSEYHIRVWADKFIGSVDGVDLNEERKKRAATRGRKYYWLHIGNDKLNVYCDYCSAIHEVLRKTYEKAINDKDKGRYICEAEGGHIGGSKKKPRPPDPLEALGQRKCTECDRILPLECFSGKKKKCKECRAKYYKEKYHERKTNGGN